MTHAAIRIGLIVLAAILLAGCNDGSKPANTRESTATPVVGVPGPRCAAVGLSADQVLRETYDVWFARPGATVKIKSRTFRHGIMDAGEPDADSVQYVVSKEPDARSRTRSDVSDDLAEYGGSTPVSMPPYEQTVAVKLADDLPSGAYFLHHVVRWKSTIPQCPGFLVSRMARLIVSAPEPPDGPVSTTARDSLPGGSSVRFRLNGHCGVEFAQIDGKTWRTPLRDDGQGNKPKSWPLSLDGRLSRINRDLAVFQPDWTDELLLFRPAQTDELKACF